MLIRKFGEKQASVLALGAAEYGGTCPAEKALLLVVFQGEAG